MRYLTSLALSVIIVVLLAPARSEAEILTTGQLLSAIENDDPALVQAYEGYLTEVMLGMLAANQKSAEKQNRIYCTPDDFTYDSASAIKLIRLISDMPAIRESVKDVPAVMILSEITEKMFPCDS